jgi:hypothetical protein
MISETERGQLIASLHNIDWSWDEGQVSPVPHAPKIVRFMEDTNREEDFIVVEFRPTTKQYGRSTNQFVSLRENDNYTEFGYGEEEIISITAMTRTKSHVHGRMLAQDWLRRIREYIRITWETLTTARIRMDSFTPFLEEKNFFAGRQYIYRMDFAMISHHGWTNQPVINERPSPELIGVDVHDTIVWIEST